MNGINGNWGNCQWSKSHKLDLRGKKCHNSTCEDLGTHLCCCIWLLLEYSSSYWFQKGRKMKACLWQRRDGNLLHLRDKGMDWLIHILVCLTKCFMWTMPTLKRGRKNPAEFIWVIYLSHLSKCGWLFFSPWVVQADEPPSLADWSHHCQGTTGANHSCAVTSSTGMTVCRVNICLQPYCR